jgi:hypothetical protein
MQRLWAVGHETGSIAEFFNFDAVGIGSAQGKGKSAQANLDRVTQRSHTLDSQMGTARQSHGHQFLPMGAIGNIQTGNPALIADG